MQRIFLGNNRPLLHLTAEYLINRFYKNGLFDMRNVLLAFHEQRAINRLEEILAEKAEKLDPAWYPPEFLTIGSLPEKFYELQKEIANDLTQCFAWLAALDQLDDENPDLLRRIIPSPPSRSDLDARLTLGRMFIKLHRELSAETLDFIRVAELCRKLKIESESERWKALDKLQKKYLAQLDSLDIWDVQSARLYALDKPGEFEAKYTQFQKDGTQILLAGIVDMNLQQKQMLRYFDHFVTPLVFAPDEEQNRFDDLGCLIPHTWQDVFLHLNDAQIHIVESVSDQAEEVLRCLTHLKGKYAPPDIIVGVPDKQVVPFIERQLEQANIETRIVAGLPIRQTPVYRFLETLLPFLESPSFASFAMLVRHPDVETFLQSKLPQPVNFISELDQYHTEFLPTMLTPAALTEPQSKNCVSVNAMYQHLQLLLKSQDLSMVLREVFAERSRDEAYHQILETLSQIRELQDRELQEQGLQEQELQERGGVSPPVNPSQHTQSRGTNVPRSWAPRSWVPPFSFADTVRLVLTQVSNVTIPMPHEPEAVELVGWLDLAMDDAEVVIVTGMNDGCVPAFQTSDMFLPDTMRRQLSVEDNSRRYARDAYALTCLLATRHDDPQRVQLIGSRRSAEGDPMLPSRLFFAADDETVTKRVRRFFAEHREALPSVKFPRQAKPEVVFPLPEIPKNAGQEIKEMRVTEFAEYKKCPYRYYLKCRLGLRKLNDADMELDAAKFGSLLHSVLELFGKTKELNRSTSAGRIRDFLVSALRETLYEQYGEQPRSVVAIQAERALKRLESFADWQARWAWDYEILATELQFGGEQFSLDVDDSAMLLRGRIDRIDRHKKTNELVIWDYKTGNLADPKHHLKNGEWVDFQLPLYYHLLGQHGEYSDFVRRGFRLGYIVLPSDVSKTGGVFADWDRPQVLSAIEEARGIVRGIWGNQFAKADLPPKYGDDFAAICHDV